MILESKYEQMDQSVTPRSGLISRRAASASAIVRCVADLDEKDRMILAELSADARRSIREVSRRVGLSANSVTERIQRMEKSGVLRGYHARRDPAALGYPLFAMVGIQLLHGGTDLHSIIDRLLEIPEVRGVHLLAGQWDLMVELRLRDHQHLRNLMLDAIWHLPGFRHSETMISLESHIRRTDWVPDDMLDERFRNDGKEPS
jgi:Lrp/AsnC family leucine-responsive transcriptional regulator